MSTLAGSKYDARAAVMAGTIWTGVVLLATIFICSRYFDHGKRPLRQLIKISFFLLPVGNIYIIPAIPYLIAAWIKRYPLGSINWWSYDNIVQPLIAMLWVPQHIASLIAGLLASICILELSNEQKSSRIAWLIILTGTAMSSCIGCSIYVAAGFIFTWFAWTILLLLKRKREIFYMFLACLIGLFLSLPFLLELRQGHPGSLPLIFAIRRFDWLEVFLPTTAPIALRSTLHFALLPVSYLLGFGALFVTTLIYLRKNSWRKMPPKEMFLMIMFIVSILLGTFIRSNIRANDFGWRVLLIGQFVAIIWSARIIYDIYTNNRKKQFLVGLLNSLFLLGIISIGVDCVLCRTIGLLFDGKQNYQMRSIYNYLNRVISRQSIIQHNPVASFWELEPFFALYSRHQVVASDDTSGRVMQPYKQEYVIVSRKVKDLFENIPDKEATAICRQYQISILIVKSSDPDWHDKSAWLWKYPIIAKDSDVAAIEVNPYLLETESRPHITI